MSDKEQQHVAVTREDLDIVTAALMARFPTGAVEERRIAHMHQVLASCADLGRMLTAYTQHGLVHCQGTRGCMDLEADTAALHAALDSWCASVRGAADRYRHPAFVIASGGGDERPRLHERALHEREWSRAS